MSDPWYTNTDLATLIGKRFIQRKDVKAVQTSNGAYMPVVDAEKNRLPFKMVDLENHVSGSETFGHYLLDSTSKCKLFAFDIDLETHGVLPTSFTDGQFDDFTHCNPREVWRDRSAVVQRQWTKIQLRTIAGRLAAAIHLQLEIPTAVAYSGNKGLHVYGFTGPIPAADAREGAMLVLDSLEDFVPLKGEHFFAHKDKDPVLGFPNLSIEVYPKQDSLDKKDLGNLMRLPLGRNKKSKDPTFFVDLTAPLGELKPMDPHLALTCENPWVRNG
jgi:hypothetical protein